MDEYGKPILDNLNHPENVTNHGQVDLTVKLGGNIYVMEIKVTGKEMEGNAELEQLRKKG